MPGNNRTQIVLGALSLVGVLGAAVFTNWDSIAGSKKEGAATVPTPAPSAQGGASQSINGSNNIQVSGSNNIVNPPTQPRACRDKSHGVESYARTFVVEQKSSWMGGGFSQDPWCNQVIGELRGQHPEGVFEVLAKSEESQSKCAPFNCPQYQYYCKVQVKTDPVYIEKLSSACK